MNKEYVMKKSAVFFTVLILAVSCAPEPAPPQAAGYTPEKQLQPAQTDPGSDVKSQTEPEEIPAGPLELGSSDAIMMMLKNNPEIMVRQLSTEISRTYEKQEQGAFSHVIGGGISSSVSEAPGTAGTDISTAGVSAGASLGKTFSSGTVLEVDAQTDISDSSGSGQEAVSSIGITVNQPLLKGFGKEVNTAELIQSRINTEISVHEFKAYAEYLAGETEKTYWDYALVLKQVEIYKESLDLANRQLEETEERITIGKLSEVERVAVQAEVASRKVSLLNAENSVIQTRLKLLKLLQPEQTSLWDRDIHIADTITDNVLDVGELEEHIKAGLEMRSDLNQARLEIRKGNLAVVTTNNGLLPRLDFFISLRSHGYEDSPLASAGEIDGKYYNASAGLTLNYPLGNAEARAVSDRAHLSLRMQTYALKNLVRVAEFEIRTAYLEVMRLKDQIPATKAARLLQEEKLKVEKEKFRIGRSTPYLVSQAQRDLLQSRIDEIESLVQYREAVIDLFLKDGMYLSRQGLSLPSVLNR